MVKISITEAIIEVLEKESRLTINEIFERSELGNELEAKIEKEEDKDKLLKLEKQLFLKRESLRNAVIRLSSVNKKKVLVKDGNQGRQYQYSLVDKAESDKALMSQQYNFMGEYMEVREDKKEEAKKYIPIIRKIKERIQ